MTLLLETTAPSPRNVPDPPRDWLRQIVQIVVGVLILSALGWAVHDWWAARRAAASPVACDFLKASDVSAVFGTPVSSGARQTPESDYDHPNSSCAFAMPGTRTAVTLYTRWTGATQELRLEERGATANRKPIQGPGITGFTGSFMGAQYAFVVRQHHFFQVSTSFGGNSASVEKLALLAAARDHALNG